MKDIGKRLCLPYLLSSQSHSPGWQLGHAPKAKPGKVVLAGLLPLALTLGGEGGGRSEWQQGFSIKTSLFRTSSSPPSWVIFQREEVGLGCLRLLRTALVPLAINPEGAGRLILSLSVLTVTGVVFCLKLLRASSSGWLVG